MARHVDTAPGRGWRADRRRGDHRRRAWRLPTLIVGSSLAAIIAMVSVSVAADATSPAQCLVGCLIPTPAGTGIVTAINSSLADRSRPAASVRAESDSDGDLGADGIASGRRAGGNSATPSFVSSSAAASPSASGPRPATNGGALAVTPVGPGSLSLATKNLSDAAFLDSIGVDVHPTYTGTTYQPDGTAAVTLSALERLGVKHVRTRVGKNPPAYLQSFFRGLAADGIKTLAVMGTPDGRWGTYAVGQSQQLLQAVTTGPYKGLLAGLEMPNEWDVNGGTAWASALHAFDAEYSTTMAASGLPILEASMAHPDGYASFRAASPSEGRNIHPYAGSALPESDVVIPTWSTASSLSNPNPALTATEFGWHNATNARGGVTEAQSAAYLLRGLLWNKTHGVSRSYIYELFDEKPEPGLTNREMHFGLVAVTGAAGSSPSTWRQREKPAFVQLKNLISHLADGGAATGRPVSYSLSGAPADVYTVPMVRSDGATDIAIWRRIALDSGATNGSATVNLNLGSAASVTQYDTRTGATRSLAAAATSVPVRISGAVTVVRVTPAH